jgi:hypothetical protein
MTIYQPNKRRFGSLRRKKRTLSQSEGADLLKGVAEA